MKKIILIFVLFTISLFGQFKAEKNGFTITAPSLNDEKKIMTVKAINNTLIIYNNSEKEHAWISFGDYDIMIKNGYVEFYAEEGEIYHPKTIIKLEFREKNLYYIILSDKFFVKKFIQAIIEGHYILIKAGEVYGFDFNKYILNIIESDFYKEIMQ